MFTGNQRANDLRKTEQAQAGECQQTELGDAEAEDRPAHVNALLASSEQRGKGSLQGKVVKHANEVGLAEHQLLWWHTQ